MKMERNVALGCLDNLPDVSRRYLNLMRKENELRQFERLLQVQSLTTTTLEVAVSMMNLRLVPHLLAKAIVSAFE